MQIYLVQHGKSKPKEEDPRKSLTSEGEDEVRRMAQTAGAYKVQTSVIIHSGKKRSTRTAEIIADFLRPAQGTQTGENLNPLDDVLPWAQKIEDRIMLVGHLPFLERLANLLVAEDPEKRVIKFQNGAIICLEKEDQGWHIKWCLMPRIE